jgi:hypothetical protein
MIWVSSNPLKIGIAQSVMIILACDSEGFQTGRAVFRLIGL